MFNFKKKKETKQEVVKAPNAYENCPDFEFVNLDDSMHEKPIQGKPTTYLKDAFKRFMKNRSSVVAFVILLVLIVMAIIVPFANKNDIKSPNPRTRYLPPKWNEVNSSHFMDGTGYLNDVVLDPHPAKDKNGELIWRTGANSGYVTEAIVGDIQVKEVVTTDYSTALGENGTGGDFMVAINKPKDGGNIFGGIQSQEVEFKLDENLSFDVTFNTKKMQKDGLSYYPAFIFGENEHVRLGDTTYTVPLEKITVSQDDYKNALKLSSAYKADNTITTIPARFAILGDVEETLAITSIKCEGLGEKDIRNNFLSWDDPTVAFEYYHKEVKIAVEGQSKKEVFYNTVTPNTLFSINGGKIYYGSFVYDYYAAAYGEEGGHLFTSSEIQSYFENGWVKGDYDSFVGLLQDGVDNTLPEGSFVLTEEGEKYCPLRKIETYSKQDLSDLGIGETIGIKGVVSWYRYDYNAGLLANCAMPKFFFGTNKSGNDFFKLVFSGLLTSLGLGFLSSFINIFIGLIWGSISGYFGGWVDLLMERFTEILGGMPWIVMMTLIVLLMGSTFWTFLLALCLTGWMGVAHLARSQFYRFKGREYVLASRTLGASDGRLIFKHILPNGIGTIITSSILMIPGVIFTEANISYLLPNALAFKDNDSFGITLSAAQADLGQYPYLIVSASIIMALIMISFNLFGNGLRDAFNPSLKGADE